MQSVGMMWLDTDKKTSFSEKLSRGVDYFRSKYAVTQDLACQVKLIPEEFEQIEGVNVTISPSILPFHFWIGLGEGDFRKDKEVKDGED